MKKIIIPFTILLLLSLALVANAGFLSTSVSRWSTGSSGISSGGDFQLATIAGQPISGTQSGGDYDLIWGFWQPVARGATVYIPLLAKPSSPSALIMEPHQAGP